MTTKSTQVSIRLTDAQAKWCDNRAREIGKATGFDISRSAVIRRLLDEVIAKDTPDPLA